MQTGTQQTMFQLNYRMQSSVIFPFSQSSLPSSPDSGLPSSPEFGKDSKSKTSSSEIDPNNIRVEGNCVVGSRKRKTSVPRRSSPLDDPNFRGVTIMMENKFIDSQWRLVINSYFTLSPKKKRKFSSYVDSSEDEETTSPYNCSIEEKHCASCSAKKTPLWRDAEDGTPLCNACGIRYKKYKLRCGTCWHIPKKDEFSPTCRSCGSFYEYVSPRR